MKRQDSCGRPAESSETFEEVLSRRIARRSFLKGAAAAAPVLVLSPFAGGGAASAAAASPGGASQSGLGFTPISLDTGDRVVVPSGYSSKPLLRWGDPVLKGAPAFDINSQTAASQAMQSGFNCDFLGFFPQPHHTSSGRSQALLTINHEYTDAQLMFPGYVAGSPTKEQVDVELAAHGLSIVEIQNEGSNGWGVRVNSGFNRRITAETEMEITGPAAGHTLLRTSADPLGKRVRGMLNNCGGGKTPWGTLLTAEENFNQYFANNGQLPAGDARRAVHARYGLPGGASERRWEQFYDRFDVANEPNEPFRFGWVVEIDPYDPDWVPRKRTALGRFKHEAATSVVAPNGRVVVYSGDDERFQFMYKFVTAGSCDAANRAANFDLLDSGTLYVAKFHDDGTGEWIPVVHGQGPLVAPAWNGQGDVLVDTRGAAAALGATKMDRPEDIETNPVNGKVYGAFTNNTNRGVGANAPADAANPRNQNRAGHVIELAEANDDPTSTAFTWEIFILCGDPANGVIADLSAEPLPIASTKTYFGGYTGAGLSPLGSPDNVAFDNAGNLWIATDGLPSTLPGNDGLFVVPVSGPDRGHLRQFLSSVRGCETAALEFSKDGEALFVSIQHPGEGSSLASPSSHFPDGGSNPPRPAVIAVTKDGRGVIGS